MNQASSNLLGISSSNRDLNKSASWGKNCFTTQFPIGVLAWMEYHSDLLVGCLIRKEGGGIEDAARTAGAALGLGFGPTGLSADFEVVSESMVRRVGTGKSRELSDVVLRGGTPPRELPDLEVKLTVVPDSTTRDLSEKHWSSELVIRTPTILHLAIRLLDQLDNESTGDKSSWDRLAETMERIRQTRVDNEDWADLLSSLGECLDYFAKASGDESPLLLQCFWKTTQQDGHWRLADNCFDALFWTPSALAQVYMDRSHNWKDGKFSRPQRSLLWLADMLATGYTGGELDFEKTKESFHIGPKNDKSCSISGKQTAGYIPECYRTHPRVPASAIKEILLGETHQWLSPERSLDAFIESFLSQGGQP